MSGNKSKLKNDPDYVPTLNMGHEKSIDFSIQKNCRAERAEKRTFKVVKTKNRLLATATATVPQKRTIPERFCEPASKSRDYMGGPIVEVGEANEDDALSVSTQPSEERQYQHYEEDHDYASTIYSCRQELFPFLEESGISLGGIEPIGEPLETSPTTSEELGTSSLGATSFDDSPSHSINNTVTPPIADIGTFVFNPPPYQYTPHQPQPSPFFQPSPFLFTHTAPNHSHCLDYNRIIENSKHCFTVTGLEPSLLSGLVQWLLQSPNIKKANCPYTLPLEDQIMVTLCRLRQDVSFALLSVITGGVSISTLTNYFHKWISIMSTELEFLITMVDRDIVYKIIPSHFRDEFPKLTSIIDCFEIFCESPKAYKPKAQLYSNYKKHSTVKFLISCTPIGSINFISRAWGGRATDCTIVKQSGFLTSKYHERNDQILADRGFDLVSEFKLLSGTQLFVPDFRRSGGDTQLTSAQVENTRKIAHVRIHIERVIGLLRNQYTILQGTLCLNTLQHQSDDPEKATIDKILIVCAALINLGQSGIVKKK